MVDVNDGFLILTYSLSCSLTLQLLKASVKPNQFFFSFCGVHVVVCSYYLVGYISKQREVPKILRKV